MTHFLQNYVFFSIVVMMMISLYSILTFDNLIKKIIGLSVFQTSVFTIFIFASFTNSTVPITDGYSSDLTFANPVPQVLILTAIVVGVACSALGLALASKIYEVYGTLEESELHNLEPTKQEDFTTHTVPTNPIETPPKIPSSNL